MAHLPPEDVCRIVRGNVIPVLESPDLPMVVTRSLLPASRSWGLHLNSADKVHMGERPPCKGNEVGSIPAVGSKFEQSPGRRHVPINRFLDFIL